MSNTRDITESDFTAAVLESEKTVVIDFWAEWCGPCKAVSPILDEIAGEHGAKLDIMKLNVDENSELAIKYGITSIPALKVFQGGQVVKTIIGAKPKSEFISHLAEYL
jgi:thioredoxin 1